MNNPNNDIIPPAANFDISQPTWFHTVYLTSADNGGNGPVVKRYVNGVLVFQNTVTDFPQVVREVVKDVGVGVGGDVDDEVEFVSENFVHPLTIVTLRQTPTMSRIEIRTSPPKIFSSNGRP